MGPILNDVDILFEWVKWDIISDILYPMGRKKKLQQNFEEADKDTQQLLKEEPQ